MGLNIFHSICFDLNVQTALQFTKCHHPHGLISSSRYPEYQCVLILHGRKLSEEVRGPILSRAANQAFVQPQSQGFFPTYTPSLLNVKSSQESVMLALSLIRQQKPSYKMRTDFKHDKNYPHLLFNSKIFSKYLSCARHCT